MRQLFSCVSLACAAMALCASIWTSARAGEELIDLSTRPGVTQRFLFETSDAPKAVLILFAGAGGALGLGMKDGYPHLGAAGNFLVRSRHDFVAHNVMVATVDAPSDQSRGMTAAFRIGPDHARDIAAVATWLKQRTAAPVWLVGTSQGSLSAASLAIRLGDQVGGLVLTSSVVSEGGRFGYAAPDGVLSLGLDRVAVPTLVMAHAKDSCRASPPSRAPVLARRLAASPRVAVAFVEGGLPARSAACEAFAPHGYYGVETEAVNRIVAFILGG